jgi:hypothetical protein
MTGANSNIYQLAQQRYILHELKLGNKIISNDELFAGNLSTLEVLDRKYWDVAGISVILV